MLRRWPIWCVALWCLSVCGCGAPEGLQPREATGPVIEEIKSAALVALEPGEALHLTEVFAGGPAPEELSPGADGRYRIELNDARQPVICVPAPYVLRQTLSVPEGAKLQTAFGTGRGSWDKKGSGVRFSIRTRQAGNTTELFSGEVRQWTDENAPNWTPVQIDIPASGAGTIELELKTEELGERGSRASEELVSSYALWVNPTVIVPAKRPRPNIILVIVDALRADRLGCYGYHRNTSPFIDSLADEGILFEDANAQATWTMPSMLSLLTSSYPLIRGARIAQPTTSDSGEDDLVVQPVSMPVSLQGELRKSGYRTLACVGGGFLDSTLGFDSGFDWYWAPQHTPKLPDQLTVTQRQLSVDETRPFFLFFHTYEVHNYFEGWGHCLDHFDRGYLGKLTDPYSLQHACLHGNPKDYSAEDLQYINDIYDGEVRHTDRYLQIFFEWLLDQPWGKNTIMVITADHGEGLGGHGAMSHGGIPYREVVRVPLVLHLPQHSSAGTRAKYPVALVDVMPTLLELAGLPSPASARGRSLLSSKKSDPPLILSESRGSALMARKGHLWYLTYRGDRSEDLYDIAVDPDQNHNIAESSPSQLAAMRSVLAELAMNGSRGYRIAVVGERTEPLSIELNSDGPLSYLDAPTLQRADSLQTERVATTDDAKPAGHRAKLRLAAGERPHVVLFEPVNPQGKISVSARLGSAPVERERFHIGSKGEAPPSLPIAIGGAAGKLLASDHSPAPSDTEEWGLWLWLPPGALTNTGRVMNAESLPDALREQLASLGYLR